jgi:hypothetical protein
LKSLISIPLQFGIVKYQQRDFFIAYAAILVSVNKVFAITSSLKMNFVVSLHFQDMPHCYGQDKKVKKSPSSLKGSYTLVPKIVEVGIDLS